MKEQIKHDKSMTRKVMTTHALADITASLALLTLIAQFAMLFLMLLSFREVQDGIRSLRGQNEQVECNTTSDRESQHLRMDSLRLQPDDEPQEEMLTQEGYEVLCD